MAVNSGPPKRAKDPLYAAVVRLLIAHGANPNERTKGGLTPLWMAAQRGGLSELTEMQETYKQLRREEDEDQWATG